MNNAYERAKNPTHSSKFNPVNKVERVYNYGEFSPPPSRMDHYIVVSGEGTYMLCRSKNAIRAEYDVIAHFPQRHEAQAMARLLNRQEDSK